MNIYLICSQWRFYVGARGHRPPKSCPAPPKFLDTVVLLLVEIIGSIVISLSLPNDEGPGPQIFFPRTATVCSAENLLLTTVLSFVLFLPFFSVGCIHSVIMTLRGPLIEWWGLRPHRVPGRAVPQIYALNVRMHGQWAWNFGILLSMIVRPKDLLASFAANSAVSRADNCAVSIRVLFVVRSCVVDCLLMAFSPRNAQQWYVCSTMLSHDFSRVLAQTES